MAILPLPLCSAAFLSFFFLFPFGKCPLTLIAFIVLLNHRQQTPCQRLIYKLWNLSGVIEQLAADIDQFTFDYDPYEYRNNADMQRYLQYDRLQELSMTHFDCWASRFGETVTALELAPEGYTLVGR